jgi:hypothetical protein
VAQWQTGSGKANRLENPPARYKHQKWRSPISIGVLSGLWRPIKTNLIERMPTFYGSRGRLSAGHV